MPNQIAKEQPVDSDIEFKSFDNYQEVALPAIKALLGEWANEFEATKERRDKRRIAIDKDREKQAGNLDQDEVWIPLRVIDSNIRKELAKHTAYLTKSPRSIICTCVEDGSVDGSLIEKDFTNRARYNGWEKSFLNWADGVETHAWDFVEILYDSSKPGHFKVDHIGHDKLMFPRGARDIQAEDFVVRKIPYTNSDLITLVKTRGFDAKQISLIVNSNKQGESDANLKRYGSVEIEKVFFKHTDGFVYVAWSYVDVCSDWIKAPRKLFLGQTQANPNFDVALGESEENTPFIQLYETSYPIEIDVYSFSEDECIMHLEGRVDLDADKAEAATSLMSSACTMMRRACQTYWSADGNSDGTEWEEAQTTVKVEANRVFKKGLKPFNMPAPEAGIFNAVYQIIGQSQQESGDVNYAVQSNKSTRKTSAEVKLAEKDNDMLSSVQVTLRSIALRNTFTRCFDIYKSRVLAGLIVVQPQVFNLLKAYSWIIKPAGDVDVIERQQKINKMMSSWPVYEQSGAKNVFLAKLTKLLFPDEADQYIKAMVQAEQEGQLMQQMLQLIMALIQDAQSGQPYLAGKLPQLMQLAQQTQQLLQQKAPAGGQSIEGEVVAPEAPSNTIQLPPPANEIEAGQQSAMVQ